MKLAVEKVLFYFLKWDLKNLFLCYLYIIVLILINDYYRSLHILEQGLLTLFLDENRILNLIRKTLIVAVIKNIISFFIWTWTEKYNMISYVIIIDVIIEVWYILYSWLYDYIT